MQNFKMATKNGEKETVDDSADTLGGKFCQNCSISHHFQDKSVFAFYAEIQDGWQNWQGK